MNGFQKILIILLTIFVVYNILVSYGVLEFSSMPTKTVNEIETKRKKNRKRKLEMKKLGLYTQAVELFRGIFMSQPCYENHQYYIQRLDLRSEALDRLLTPEEVRGEKVLPFLLSIVVVPLGLFWPVVLIIPVLTLHNLITYQTIYKARISD